MQLDGVRSGDHLEGNAVHQINEPNNGQQTWWRDAEIILAARAASGAPFTADDLRADGLDEPVKPAYWGMLFQQAQAHGVIVSVGVMNSRRRQRRGSLGRVWVGATGEGIAA
ncbi:hypothetical protein [Dermacoccus nishinomiyaensis]|uniref:hypothetical protein n=1 Tax=Dermacoccus nishinomiyaensis TaxID=1274 RepID=UPI000E1C0724|nr:hypothetical protein [Dermacoccus nishinomiyaensis]